MRKFITFYCPMDDTWMVCTLEGNRATGIAQCPDALTTDAVLEAMQMREDLRIGDKE